VVRAPARIDRDFHFSVPTSLGSIPFIVGGPDFESEIADVFELGYRAQPSASFSYSVTAFYNFYDQLRSGHQPPAVIDNQSSGTTSGVEAWATYQVTRDWRLSGGLTLLNKNLELDANSDDQQTGTAPLGDDPDYQWNLRSTFNLSARHEFDVAVRRVGKLPDPDVPAYTAVDLRLGWRPTSKLDLSLAVRNLFDSEHREFDPGNPVLVGATPEIGRSFFIKAVWRL
jgi:iron complex outermembrane receptor protein